MCAFTWRWMFELQGYRGDWRGAEAQMRGLSASSSSTSSTAALPIFFTSPGCHRGPATLHCLQEQGRNTDAVAAGVTNNCQIECYPQPKHDIQTILEATIFRETWLVIFMFWLIYKNVMQAELLIILASMVWRRVSDELPWREAGLLVW